MYYSDIEQILDDKKCNILGFHIYNNDVIISLNVKSDVGYILNKIYEKCFEIDVKLINDDVKKIVIKNVTMEDI